jgi:ubiquinone/menaquinone biosynthesis C-methylase UbiE
METLIMPRIMNANWEHWGDDQYANLMYRRAIGDLPEMECSKAAARRVASCWVDGDTILDIGCGAGHYLYSLRRVIGDDFKYTGTDITERHLALARMAFGNDPRAHFERGDIFDLQYEAKSFDIVICNNLVQNLPNIAKPLAELVRVARKAIIVRLLCGERTFLVREVHPHKPELDSSGEPYAFNYYNIYSRTYLEDILSQLPEIRSCSIELDREFDVNNIDGSLAEGRMGAQPTTTIGGHQVNGYILLPWSFLTVFKEAETAVSRR